MAAAGVGVRLAEDVPALRDAVATSGASGRGPVLVPTMGALHDGHLALVRRARGLGRPVVVSIFVNPTQFAPGEDLARYPRTPENDLRRCAEAGADVVFMPPETVVYPGDVAVAVPPLPEVATAPGLEDAARPGHFAGVAQVVARLFDLARPRCAVFGEKDYQQLLVIRQLVAAVAADAPARWGDLDIEAGPTVREPDGLAMSSRNAYLDPQARASALGLIRGLRAAAAETGVPSAEQAMATVLAAHGVAVDYAVVRDAETLQSLNAPAERPGRALIAARVGAVRLIDNMAWGGG